MRHANPTRGRFAFKHDRLPNPAEYCWRRFEAVACQVSRLS